MVKYKNRLGFFLLALLLLFAGKVLFSQVDRQSHQRKIILQSLQNVQKLEVLEANLLAHDSFQSPAFLNNNEFVIIAQAKAIYSLNLAQLEIEGDREKISLKLPPIRVQDLVITPENLSFIGLKKGFLTSQSEFEALKQDAAIRLKKELLRQAQDSQLIAQAENNAKTYLQSLLKSLGHQQIQIEFTNRSLKP